MRRGRLQSFTALITVVIPAFALVLAGIAKLDDPFLAGRFIKQGLNIDLHVAFTLARAVALIEIILGVALCAFLGRSGIPAYASMCLLMFFAGLVVNVARSEPNAAACGCFGGLFGDFLRRSLWSQVYLDFALIIILGGHLVAIRSMPTHLGPVEGEPAQLDVPEHGDVLEPGARSELNEGDTLATR